MLGVVILVGVLAYGLVLVNSADIGPGLWHVNYINKCEEDTHKFKFDISQSKVNRTHDGFNAKIFLEEAFTDEFGVRVDICKYVDGGCKPYQVLSDDCFLNFINKYAKNNVQTCLEYAGVDPPEFPIEEGDYEVKDFVFDYSELPTDGAYGEFCAKCFMLRDTEEVGCVEVTVEFKEVEDE